jgi:hypothetical protein
MIDLGSHITAEWALIDLDLTPFAGQIISLRFRLDAALAEDESSVGYWLDDLTLQDVPPLPTVEPVLEVTPAE